ncbi:insulinase family protein [Candidatus Giovannonibacteria bacterium]|nr:insulinase family protein [Candidatus Giovannonibacteria bacterium]
MNYEKRTLKNGLRAIVAPMKDSPSATLLVLFGTGSKYETKRLNGISHFLEHLFFKGTKHRPKPGQVHKDLDRLGAQHNAFTSKEITGYYVKAASKHFDVSLDIVSDILLEPLFIKEEIEKERGVILQEISMYEDDPRRQAFEVFEELLYGDQPAGWDTAGYPHTVKNIERNDILKYRASHYLTSNAVVIVAGNVDPEETFQKIEKSFSKMKDGKKVEKIKTKETQKTPKILLKKKEVDQAHIRLGVRSYDMFDKRRYAAAVLQTILGGNASSRLFMELREKLGLTYYVMASLEEYSDSGYLVAAAGVPHDSSQKTVEKMVSIFTDLRKKGVTAEELKFAKEFIRGSMALQFESTDEVAMFLASQEIFRKKIMTPEELLAKIEEVEKDDIARITRDIFQPQKLNLSAITANTEEKPYAKILRSI